MAEEKKEKRGLAFFAGVGERHMARGRTGAKRPGGHAGKKKKGRGGKLSLLWGNTVRGGIAAGEKKREDHSPRQTLYRETSTLEVWRQFEQEERKKKACSPMRV